MNPPKENTKNQDEFAFRREFWTGDSRDGHLENGDGYHYYRMTPEGLIVEAYETYETEDGQIVVSLLPEMQNVHWVKDLGFEDFEVLEDVSHADFEEIRSAISSQ